ncbi:MAG: hypothetical protein ACD_2C00258G0002 [uncultured bacterium (gcode 4)]|uniref:Uncharacterized protein n=1 Tax=uncultured bacterium (gcode 4) TaxID=1234023 RepID=K2G3R4_9BACT|nr:MAG: hypothetical protein ACD_2C00258G0002 [uncultured bacterium (gcode 4)]
MKIIYKKNLQLLTVVWEFTMVCSCRSCDMNFWMKLSKSNR